MGKYSKQLCFIYVMIKLIMERYMDIEILLQKLAKPAQRAIQNEGITTLEQLSKYDEKEFFQLHGIGKNARIIVKKIMSENGLSFTK